MIRAIGFFSQNDIQTSIQLNVYDCNTIYIYDISTKVSHLYVCAHVIYLTNAALDSRVTRYACICICICIC